MTDPSAMHVPCSNLIEHDAPECKEGRKVPEDCTRFCAYYSPGLTAQERKRALTWFAVRQAQPEETNAWTS